MVVFAACYCIGLVLLHFFGAGFLLATIWGVYASGWDAYGLDFVLAVIIALPLHYLLLWNGYKKNLLDKYVIVALGIVDLFWYGRLVVLCTDGFVGIIFLFSSFQLERMLCLLFSLGMIFLRIWVSIKLLKALREAKERAITEEEINTLQESE